jgi:hypothetical protein
MLVPTTSLKWEECPDVFLNSLITTKGNLRLFPDLTRYSSDRDRVIQSHRHEIADLASDVLAMKAPSLTFTLVEDSERDKGLPRDHDN